MQKNNIGKCFSLVNKGQRLKSDTYQTPYSITEQLLENEKFDYNKSILEPACGDGAIVDILLKYFKSEVFGTDLIFKGDFFKRDNKYGKYDYIITNPPFSLAFEFIRKSKQIAKEKFAMLLPLSYLHGQKRYENKIFTDEKYPLTKIHVFTRYPLLTDSVRADGKYNTGMMVYAWYIWENKLQWNHKDLYREYPLIQWIDNNKYVLRK